MFVKNYRRRSGSLTDGGLKSMICMNNHTRKGGVEMNVPEGKYAWTVTVGSKGQIVIPKEAREIFGIGPGDTLILLGDREQGLAIPPGKSFDAIFSNIFGGERS
jgi:AbrB family looped-hinge helix DNA binding protein